MQKKLVICTVGTSIASESKISQKMIRKPSNWSDNIEGIQKEIEDYLATEKVINDISAEINVLNQLELVSGDKIILLASDSLPGRASAEAVKNTIINIFKLKPIDIEIRQIEGLQVRNAKLLREKGLKNFVKIVLEYLEKEEYKYSYEIILNPTGGFKGVIPFLTTLGMLYGKRIVYIFEHADELIDLPPLPFAFDLEIYERVLPALNYIEENVAVAKETFLAKILDFSPEEEDLFMAFTEPLEEQITISTLAYCLLKSDKMLTDCFVTKETMKMLAESNNNQSIMRLQRLISKSANPLWRQSHMHRWNTTDLLIMKKGNSAERIAGFVKKGIYYITLAYTDHQEYEMSLKNYKKSDFDNKEFISWNQKEKHGISEVIMDAEGQEIEKLREENKVLKNIDMENSEKIKEYDKLAGWLQKSNHAKEGLTKKLEEAKKGNEQLKANNKMLTKELKEYR